ncbi:general odorant-binding protein 19d-like isoform X3 [Frankliniella occidentalis]|uniref:General odorant-binding protein 19d-like isoform X3 n=1 Tax=Frankliniella occidentalis TaxID=133901 RepID=A0A6J1S6L1_FRAOC|nr:general odorant-binding protein 19d-like isoform X3 [Frankliniella occidentalis]
MKVFVLLAVALVAYASADEAARERAKAIKKECKEQAGATDDDLKELKEKDELLSPVNKKLMACVFSKNKIMQNNKFSKEGSMEVARELMSGRPESETKLKIAEQIADNCAKEIGNVETTGDEMAKLIFNCLKKQAKEKIAGSANH